MPPEEDEEEEDYMSMIIPEPTQKETFSKRKLRLQREAEARAKVPSKSERAAQEAARRDEALSTSTLDPTNKGFQMMAKLGFKPGQALGKASARTASSASDTGRERGAVGGNANGDDDDDDKTDGTGGVGSAGTDDAGRKAHAHAHRTEPLNLVFKEGRGGIGLDNEKKRKIREEAEDALKRVKRDEGDYRDRVREERELKRLEGQVVGAQKVAERLDGEAEGEGAGGHGEEEEKEKEKEKEKDEDEDEKPKPKATIKPTKQINLLYRGLVRERQERERDLHARHALQSSLPSSFFPTPRLPGYDDPTLDRDDKEALGTRRELSSIVEEELDEEDPELEEFNELEPAERLRRLVLYLRERHQYCFWCKYRYDTGDMEGCPGLTEEDHD